MNKSVIVLASTLLIVVAGLFIFMSPQPSDAATRMVVYQDPNCGCCSQWIDHVRAAGIEVEIRKTNEMAKVKLQNGISRNLQSCHTGVIDGYIVEGHVPAKMYCACWMSVLKSRAFPYQVCPLEARVWSRAIQRITRPSTWWLLMAEGR